MSRAGEEAVARYLDGIREALIVCAQALVEVFPTLDDPVRMRLVMTCLVRAARSLAEEEDLTAVFVEIATQEAKNAAEMDHTPEPQEGQ